MFYIVESDKSFAEVCFDMEPVVQRLGFVVAHVLDMGEILRRKGIEIDDECQVFEVLNYRYVEKMLAIDLRLSLSIPWRISVYTENGATKIAAARPDALLPEQAVRPGLIRLAAEIEARLTLIVDETR